MECFGLDGCDTLCDDVLKEAARRSRPVFSVDWTVSFMDFRSDMLSFICDPCMNKIKTKETYTLPLPARPIKQRSLGKQLKPTSHIHRQQTIQNLHTRIMRVLRYPLGHLELDSMVFRLGVGCACSEGVDG